MSCFFGRRAGKPSAIIRKRPIVYAVAGIAEASNAMVSLTESQTKTRNDKDPLEHKLRRGCVGTKQPRKRLAAECREETTHLKLVSKRSQDAWVMQIVVNEGEKIHTHT